MEFVHEAFDVWRRVNLYERDEVVFERDQWRHNFSQQIAILDDDGQEASEDDVDQFKRPRGEQAGQTDGVGPVPRLDDFGVEVLCHLVVVVPEVAEQDDVAGDFDDGQRDADDREDERRDVLEEPCVQVARRRNGLKRFFISSWRHRIIGLRLSIQMSWVWCMRLWWEDAVW